MDSKEYIIAFSDLFATQEEHNDKPCFDIIEAYCRETGRDLHFKHRYGYTMDGIQDGIDVHDHADYLCILVDIWLDLGEVAAFYLARHADLLTLFPDAGERYNILYAA